MLPLMWITPLTMTITFEHWMKPALLYSSPYLFGSRSILTTVLSLNTGNPSCGLYVNPMKRKVNQQCTRGIQLSFNDTWSPPPLWKPPYTTENVFFFSHSGQEGLTESSHLPTVTLPGNLENSFSFLLPSLYTQETTILDMMDFLPCGAW